MAWNALVKNQSELVATQSTRPESCFSLMGESEGTRPLKSILSVSGCSLTIRIISAIQTSSRGILPATPSHGVSATSAMAEPPRQVRKRTEEIQRTAVPFFRATMPHGSVP